MSIIQKIQDKGAWIVSVLIGIALISFIMMDYSKGNNMFSNNTTVGKVNGEKITYVAFNDKVNQATQQMQAQGQNAPREAVQENVWNYLVQTTLLQQAYDQLGLVCTQRDIQDALAQNPPQELRQAFTNPQTGQYDATAAANAIAQIRKKGTAQQKAAIAQLIDQTTQQVMVAKYQSLLMSGAYVPSWLAQKTLTDVSAAAKVAYVTVPYTSVPDNAVKVSDDEINAYVAAHKKQFEQKDETRSLGVIVFNGAANPADSAAVRSTLNDFKPAFATTNNDSAYVASKGSAFPYENQYLSLKSMQKRQLPYAQILNTPTDSITGPYVFEGNYVLAKMVGKISMPDSVKVRHILVATIEQDPQSGQYVPFRDDSAALKRLDSAVAAIKSGASFDSIAQVYSDDKASAQKGGVIDYFASGDMVPQFNDFAFSGKTGDTKIVKTQYGYHYIEILGQVGSTEGYKIASITRSIDPSQTTSDSVNNVAAEFVAASQTGSAFNDNARKRNLIIVPINGLKENDYQIGQFGVNRDLVKWAYSHKTGDVSQPIEIGTNVLVATLTSDVKPGLPPASAARPYVQTILANRKKAKMIIDSKFKGNTLESYAQSAGTSIATVDSLSFESGFIPNVGSEPKVTGAVFNTSLLNKVSTPIAGNTGVFAIQPLSVFAKSFLNGGPAQIKAALVQNWMQQMQRNFVGGLQKDAKIDDYRSKFF